MCPFHVFGSNFQSILEVAKVMFQLSKLNNYEYSLFYKKFRRQRVKCLFVWSIVEMLTFFNAPKFFAVTVQGTNKSMATNTNRKAFQKDCYRRQHTILKNSNFWVYVILECNQKRISLAVTLQLLIQCFTPLCLLFAPLLTLHFILILNNHCSVNNVLI